MAPLDTVIAELLPKAEVEPAFKVPALIVVALVYVLAPDKTIVPPPERMIPVSVIPWVKFPEAVRVAPGEILKAVPPA